MYAPAMPAEIAFEQLKLTISSEKGLEMRIEDRKVGVDVYRVYLDTLHVAALTVIAEHLETIAGKVGKG